MEAAIIHFGEAWETIAATSLIAGILRVVEGCRIHWITTPESYAFLQYNEKLASVMTSVEPIQKQFDFVLNLTPTIESSIISNKLISKTRFGFVYDKENNSVGFADSHAMDLFQVMKENRNINKTFLQVLFRSVGIIWRGEGYDLSYFPKNRVKKGKTGIAIGDEFLRTYVKRNLKLDLTDIWHIPMRKNLLKRIDEINRCKIIVTDDLFVVHAGLALRKEVHFLDTKNLQMHIEFFGRGRHYHINNYDAW